VPEVHAAEARGWRNGPDELHARRRCGGGGAVV
jgi:hypothetical protein